MRRNIRQLVFWVSVLTVMIILVDPNLAGQLWSSVLNHFGTFFGHFHIHKPSVHFHP